MVQSTQISCHQSLFSLLLQGILLYKTLFLGVILLFRNKYSRNSSITNGHDLKQDHAVVMFKRGHSDSDGIYSAGLQSVFYTKWQT